MHLELKNIRKTYPATSADSEPLTVLRGVTLDIPSGEFVVLTGPSGSGKSTLLHLLGGLDTADSGTFCADGLNLETFGDTELARYRSEKVGIVFQFFNLLSHLTVWDNVLMPFFLKPSSVRLPLKDAQDRAQTLLERVGLSARRSHRAHDLSGGEMQRTALCRALLLKPSLVLADEPTGNLDSRSGEEVLGLLREFAKEEKATTVLITHDERLARPTDRRVRLADGKIL